MVFIYFGLDKFKLKGLTAVFFFETFNQTIYTKKKQDLYIVQDRILLKLMQKKETLRRCSTSWKTCALMKMRG